MILRLRAPLQDAQSALGVERILSYHCQPHGLAHVMRAAAACAFWEVFEGLACAKYKLRELGGSACLQAPERDLNFGVELSRVDSKRN